MADDRTASDVPDVGAAVQALQPQLRRQSLVATAGVTALGIATFILAMLAWNAIRDDPGERFKISGLAVLVGGLCISLVLGWQRRAQESLVMPLVARAAGLAYQKNATDFRKSLPARLLPKNSVQKAEDQISGQLGNHTIHMAEIKVETGGKNSRTLFKGVVARLQNRVAMPAFFLAPHAQTTPGFFGGAWMPTDGLYHLRDVTSPTGAAYGLWTSWTDREEPPALAAVVRVLTELESTVGKTVTLFSATSNGETMHLALSHPRDLYRIGGLFPTSAGLFAAVHAATQDLSLVLDLARQLIAAEEIAARSMVPTA
jgi:hypothetical protein